MRESILNSLSYFHVTSSLPPDIMHDVLEGALQVETKCILKALIREKHLFTLGLLNEHIRNFPFGSDVKDRPQTISSNVFTSESTNATKQYG